LVLQLLAPGGTARQLPARQNSPAWQSAFLPQLPEQKPWVQASPAVHWVAEVHRVDFAQVPLLQLQELRQSEVWEQLVPGHPWEVHSSSRNEAPSPLTMVQPANNSAVSSKAKREFMGVCEERGRFVVRTRHTSLPALRELITGSFRRRE
jgi:hypothetical protein